MRRSLLHLLFILATLGIGVLVTILGFPILEAGHAAPVLTLLPAFLLGHLVFAPLLLQSPRTGAGRIGGAGTGLGVFMVSGALFWFLMLPLSTLFEWSGDSDTGIIGYWLAWSVGFLLVSSILLEVAWRLRRNTDQAPNEAR